MKQFSYWFDGDYITIYDIDDDGNFRTIARLTGTDSGPQSYYHFSNWQKKIISSSSSNMLVEFRADNIIQHMGLTASLEQVGFSASIQYSPISSQECERGLKIDKKIIQSPNYPDSYDNEMSCKWLISVPHGYHLTLKFLQFDVRFSIIFMSDIFCTYFLSSIYTIAGGWD